MTDEQAETLRKALDAVTQNAEDGRTILILTAISDARQEATQAIAAVGTTVAEFHGDITARMTAVERHVDTNKRHNWILSYIVLPVLAVLHAICAHFGIRV